MDRRPNRRRERGGMSSPRHGSRQSLAPARQSWSGPRAVHTDHGQQLATMRAGWLDAQRLHLDTSIMRADCGRGSLVFASCDVTVCCHSLLDRRAALIFIRQAAAVACQPCCLPANVALRGGGSRVVSLVCCALLAQSFSK